MSSLKNITQGLALAGGIAVGAGIGGNALTDLQHHEQQVEFARAGNDKQALAALNEQIQTDDFKIIVALIGTGALMCIGINKIEKSWRSSSLSQTPAASS